MSVLCLAVVYGIYVMFFGYSMRGSFWGFMLSYLLVLVSLYSIGMMLASVSPNMKTANLLCCLVYFPMLFFSGATLPYEVMPAAMQKTIDFFPLTQGIKMLKATSLGMPLDNVLFPLIEMIVLAIICIWLSIRFFRWE